MIKQHKGTILIFTLVFVALSSILVSQVTVYLIQNTKLLDRMEELVNLQLLQENIDKAVEYQLRQSVNWQALEAHIHEHGTVTRSTAINFDLLPPCSLMPNSNWLQLTQPLEQKSEVYSRVLSPAIMKEQNTYFIVLITTCTHQEDGLLGARSIKVYEYTKDEILMKVVDKTQFLPRRLL